MQFLSLTLQNYRVHRHLQVEFSRDLNLIGGPNESGKSTLVEALHRVLFLRAKGGSEEHRAMRSHAPGAGHPSVTLRFQAQGRAWTLQKTFSGQSGTVSLTTAGEPALEGEAADTRLAALLGVDGPAAGKQLPLQWAHLWLWQGTAAADPTGADKLPAHRLTPRLQNHGGAADLLSSPLDQRLLAHFETATERYFTANGKPAANGPLGRAEQTLTEARARHTAASDRVQRYERALAEHEDATTRLAELERSATQLEEETTLLHGQASALRGLREQETREDAEATRLGEAHAQLQRVHEEIAEKQGRHAKLAEELAPLSARTAELEEKETAARGEFTRTEQAREHAVTAAARARAEHDLLAAAASHRQIAENLARLETRDQERTQRQAELEKLRADLARLPAIDDKVLKQLTKLETEVTKTEATLGSLATGIELLTTDAPVHLGDKALVAGNSVIITADTELHLAAGRTRLRIRPGGGTSLADARVAAERARTALATALAEYAVRDLEAARAAAAERALVTARLAQADRDLAAPDFARLDADLAAARVEFAQIEGRLQRLRAADPTLTSPEDPSALTSALERAAAAKETAATQEIAAGRAATAALRVAEQARHQLDEHRQRVTAQANALRDLAAQLGLLRQNHGEDIPRTARLAEAATAAQTAATRLGQTRRAIAELQPEQLDRNLARLARSRELADRDRSTQDERRITALATLRSDGVDDPVRDVAESAAALARAETAGAAVRRDAEAVRLVRDLYHQAQQTLADRFTQPLVERIGGYLACLFGPFARVTLRHTPDGFTDLALSRDQGPAVAFEALSMGAREQVAAAVRLAAAEFLAADHDGVLPVIFDDAFAYADPERVRSLQAMLDFAAGRGLQIIVLSCTPADYASLGARTLILARPSPPGNAVATGDSDARHVPPLQSDDAESDAPAADHPAFTSSDLAERFLAELTAAHAAGEPLVSSTSLRRSLNCEREPFNATRDALLAAGRIVVDGRSQRLAD